MTDTRTYSRVYHEIVDHPRFERVYRNPHALGTWLQMLLTADAMYPMTPEMPPRNPTVRLLIDCGLVIPRPSNRYSMRGLTEERERRAASGRIGAAVRWQSGRNADAMPRRDETSKEEKSNGANASKEARPAVGFQPPSRAPRLQPSLQGVVAQHEHQWDPCGQCGQRRGGPAHAPGRSDHSFQESDGTP